MNNATLSSFKMMIFLSLFCATTSKSSQYSIKKFKINPKVQKEIVKKHNETLLRTSAQDSNTEELNRLLYMKVNVNAQTDIGAESALHGAAKNGNVDIVKILLNESKINVNIQNSKKLTPLYYALESLTEEKEDFKKFVTIIEKLLDKDAQIAIGTKRFDNGLALTTGSTPSNEQDIEMLEAIFKTCSKKTETYPLDIVYPDTQDNCNKEVNKEKKEMDKEKRKYFNHVHYLLVCKRLENPDLSGVKDLADTHYQISSTTRTIVDLHQFYHCFYY